MAYRKILAIKLRALGDTVLMTAPLMELRQAYPEAEIHAAVLAPWASILDAHPAVDKTWAFKRHSDRASRAKGLASLAYKLRKERFDCVVCFHASPSSAMLAFATGAKIRSIHFHGHHDKNRYSTVMVPGKGVLKPIIERDMDTVRALGLHVPAGRLPNLALQASEVTQAQERLSKLNLPSPVLGIGLGASRPTKHWPVERFAALAIEWCKTKKGGVLAITGPGEEALAHEFMRAMDDQLTAVVADPAERARIRGNVCVESGLPIRQTAAVLSALSVFAGNDSGPRHLAVAVDTPTLTLFGPEHPFEWHPYPPDRHPHLFVDALPCRKDADPGMPAWCALDICGIEQHKCMRGLGVDQALAECLRVARS